MPDRFVIEGANGSGSPSVHMDSAELNQIRKKIMSQSFPSRGADLAGMQADFDASLDASQLLTDIKVQKTGQPNCLIRAACKLQSDRCTVAEVVAEVERIWMEELRYRHFE